jgi:hypothetical protein
MIRIKESVEAWEKHMDINGYYSFVEDYMGKSISQDEELKYTVYIGENYAGI